MLSISDFKKLYIDIKTFPYYDNDELKKDSLKTIFLDYFCNRFKELTTIYKKFDWCAVTNVLKFKYLFNY